MMFEPSSRLLFINTLILCTLLFLQIPDIQAQVGHLPPSEVDALHEIAKQLGKEDWNFSLNPCDGNANWRTPTLNSQMFNNVVNCTCSPDDACHVVNISLKGQDLAGVLPPSLAKLPYIKWIDLSYNYLTGTIPNEWASTKLVFVSASANRLSGRIPAVIGNLTTLEYLTLENNMFSGKLPVEIGKLKNLKLLILTANNLTGELPMELTSLTNLTELRLDSNYFSGRIPNLGSLTQLEKLMLRGCNLRGSIPGYLSQMSNLQYLDLSFNDLGGDIPDLSDIDLEKMYLTGNFFNGSVPSWLTDEFDNEREVDLSYNNFSDVPQSCYERLNLFRSYTSTNDSDLGKCLKSHPCLKTYYSVHINCGGPKVTIGDKVYEADQDLTGAARFLPSNDHWGTSNTGSYWNRNPNATINDYVATNVSILSMKDSQLYTVARRSPLSLTYYGRCLANGNYTVTLHFAEIIFRESRSFKGLGRRVFDVYVQGVNTIKNFDIKNEAGGVDKAVIKTFNNVRVTNGTLEIRFQYTGKGTTAVPERGLYGSLISAISMESEFKPLELKQISHGKKRTFLVIGVVVAVLLLILTVVGIAWKKGYIGNQISRERGLRGSDVKTGVFTYKQIKAATDNFAESNKLGEGGFGSVYKGALLDGTLIAVKQLSSKSKQGNREFVNEIGMITGIQHPNVVRLHGCCAEHNQLLLVYEYMENNSLAHALFDQDESKMEIDWPTRQRICVGIARGLAFLHEETTLKMVHRDIKAANILLDSELTPKISDFGLAKLNEKENTHISTRVAGTLGYMAPEYALWGHLTYKADVFSFGVLALEIIAGKNNMKSRPNEDYVSLLDLAVVLKEKGTLMDLVDPRLGSDFNKIEAERMIEVSILCTNQSPAFRPTMSEVVNMLEGHTIIKEIDMSIGTLEDDLRLQAVKGNIEHTQPPHDSVIHQSSSSIYDLYDNNQISEES
ncbi:probable leucine-rich repeat receptor-like serine/threonine-protein kinase At3g14840 isoform X3 [Helianthus annuus]|uniref:probable leucine-rich repeat receptor-like serine/threonine-protein kinase At3g14840 isoform X3 n=1 Tax=Helianthus annuus TaxID=4232 RepID=UPI001652BDB4|nr:probable leucine-rich repeat receptor-like serine/threonine-protein kinase At3g14840 isoform X3 [Helianthus annuus]